MTPFNSRILIGLGFVCALIVGTGALPLPPNNKDLGRRDLLTNTATAIVAASTWSSPGVAVAAGAGGNVKPIAILGASGKTGALCVAVCLRRGIPVRALTRSGEWPPTDKKISLTAVNFDGNIVDNPLLTIAACDVKDATSLDINLAGCRGVIYAASASKKGGNSKEIDFDGVVAAADACVKNGVSRYVLLSSGGTTRPNSLGFKFTEMAVAGIMTNKRLGEVGMNDVFANSKSSSYTIVRPGGLDEPKQNIINGPSALEISQGDVLAGYVSRADVAEVAVETALSTSKNLQNTAFELYYGNKIVTVDKKYRKYLHAPDGFDQLHGDTYEDLFKGVKPNFDYIVDP